MKITDKINFRQPKYMLPAIVYFPLLFTGYFVCDIFNFKKPEDNSMETTNYFNEKLPSANIKGDGIGQKYQNMVENFGKIKDGSAVENIEGRTEKEKEKYESQYTDAELAAMDSTSESSKTTAEQIEAIKNRIHNQQKKDESISSSDLSEDERKLLELRKALAEAQEENSSSEEANDEDLSEAARKLKTSLQQNQTKGKEDVIEVNANAVKSLDENDKTEEVVKKHEEASDYFNTINNNEANQKLIKAIVDEDVKAVDGSRVRLRLLDDIDVGERTIRKGSYLYCIMSGFGQQRVKGNVTSVLFNDELVKINLSIYDMDGLEGLYVPRSSFRETSKDITGGALDQSMNFNSTTSENTFSQWGMQALQNAYQKTTNALSKSIRKNKVKIKYGTHVYLINSKNIKTNKQ